MANAAEIADLITQGMQGPTGPEDVAFHTGVIRSWDIQSGTNVVVINSVEISNLRALQGGIGIAYFPGDVVVVMRKQRQYFIMGKVAAPGGAAGSGVQSTYVPSAGSTTSTSFGDLAGTPGPSVSTYIGSSRRVVVLANVGVSTPPDAPGIYSGGWFTLAVTGASTIVPVGGSTPFWAAGAIQWEGDFFVTASQTWLVDARHGLQPGLNTFTLKYRAQTAGSAATFDVRNITVMPI